ncbi:MAG: flagellar biosynthesis protein FlhB [Planctomycetota bacterium]|nr:flagellar biosynthesis protein FlhB [Planctomycetota bacterium]
MAEQDEESKTEPASPRRREEARKEGRVARSQDLGAALSVLGGLIAISAAGPHLVGGILELFTGTLPQLGTWNASAESVKQVLAQAGGSIGLAMIGLMLIVLVIGVGGTVAQVGWNLNSQLLSPKWERIDPMQGFQRLFSMQSVGSLVAGCLKLGAIALTAYLFIHPLLPEFPQMAQLSVREILPRATGLMASMGWRIVLAMLAIGAADYIFQWWRLEKSLRMTKQEVKEENKDQEGDPHIKSKVKSIQRQMAMRRMMNDVPKATVVITNPTHVAVALRYEPESMAAPVVVAMGERLVAQRIKARARDLDIPVIEEPPLARAMLRASTVGREIPPAFYRAVAQVMALVMRNRRGPRPQPLAGLSGGLA